MSYGVVVHRVSARSVLTLTREMTAIYGTLQEASYFQRSYFRMWRWCHSESSGSSLSAFHSKSRNKPAVAPARYSFSSEHVSHHLDQSRDQPSGCHGT
jgi:hypothetical protein